MNFLCLKERLTLIFIVVFLVLPETSFSQNNSFAEQRKQMVIQQFQSRGITDKVVLDAFLKVPRHKFVLPEYIKFAYMDSPLPIAEGQTISQPYIVAFMTDALELQPTDKVLEVGTGSGYQAAILAQVCDSVFTIEIFNSLGKKATQTFNDLGYKNIYCKIGDGYQGWRAHAPYDAIIVTCSPTHVPQPLKDQLAEGGRMIIPVGEEQVQQLVLLHKKNGKIREKKVLPVRFVPMINTENRRY